MLELFKCTAILCSSFSLVQSSCMLGSVSKTVLRLEKYQHNETMDHPKIQLGLRLLIVLFLVSGVELFTARFAGGPLDARTKFIFYDKK